MFGRATGYQAASSHIRLTDEPISPYGPLSNRPSRRSQSHGLMVRQHFGVTVAGREAT